MGTVLCVAGHRSTSPVGTKYQYTLARVCIYNGNYRTSIVHTVPVQHTFMSGRDKWPRGAGGSQGSRSDFRLSPFLAHGAVAPWADVVCRADITRRSCIAGNTQGTANQTRRSFPRAHRANKAHCPNVPGDKFVRRVQGAIQAEARVRIIARHPPHLRPQPQQSCSVSDPTACRAY